jgi:hypothetical protein
MVENWSHEPRRDAPNPRGRPKGSRHKLSEAFFAALSEDFEEFGLDAVQRTRAVDPAAHCRVVSADSPVSVRVDSPTRSRLVGAPAVRLQKGDLPCLLWARAFKTVQGRQLAQGAAQVGKPLPEEPDMTSPILESVSVCFVDRHVVPIMGHEMPPRDPNDDDDEDEKDEEDEEQNDEPAVIKEPDEDE